MGTGNGYHMVENEHLLHDDNNHEVEKGIISRENWRENWRCTWETSAKALTTLNIFLLIVLVSMLGVSSVTIRQKCVPDTELPALPYSPVREDGYVRYVNKRFAPSKLFQSETSDELEAAWNKTLGSTDGVVQLPKSIASRLDRSIESFVEPGQYIYGVGMFHQLHCLNRIRRTFYADKFFPGESKDDIDFHKNHCFDLLRQSILCAGDVSMVYWWNQSYTYTDERGQEQYSQRYLSMSNVEKARHSFAYWDVEARCHDTDAIYEWAEKNKVNVGVNQELFNGSTGDP
ncbi:hypothetical protein RJZ56_005912 [Blastomyces dermatitidis]|uniref:Tat pathway signal sequence n=1 Tax=Ajellomyces dermatitidis (strain ATCC 18188 / CBS 674.68) TaxID=653446 RepID=F2TGV8_AJEDA|nr:hypothetical protein BDDG_05415 [Blastomyces dermatitidis ATCC 18188]